jgi:diguanylate cyclase (GGDEF)-like protein
LLQGQPEDMTGQTGNMKVDVTAQPAAGAPTPAVALSAAALDRLMPLHLVLAPDGRIVGAGPTLRKIIARCVEAGDPLIGQGFFDMFDLRRPGGLRNMADLTAHAGERLTIFARSTGSPGFRGVVLPLGTGGLILNLSFGFGVIDAVRDYGLTDADFAVTDLAMELLYLVEAKSAVMEELRNLNERLQGAKRTAEVQALTDTLTGLRNRRALDLTLADLVDRGQGFGLMHIDLDYFKTVNDTLGHAAGDHVLRQVAAVLLDETRKGDLVARVGGDEFVVVFPLLHDAEALGRIAGRMVERLSAPIDFEGHPCLISASIGVAVSTNYDVLTPDRILSDADEALYASKHAGRGRALFHSPPRRDQSDPDRRQSPQN